MACGVNNQLDPDVDSRSRAVFGQATVNLTSRLSGTAGLRYTHEDKSIVNGGRLVTLDTPSVVVAGSAYDYADSISHAAWTPKLGVEARLAEGPAGLRLGDARLQERRVQPHVARRPAAATRRSSSGATRGD